MSQLPPSKPMDKEASLPRRDLFLLPAISLLTIAVMVASTTLIVHYLYPTRLVDSCNVIDPHIGLTARPSCTSRMKNTESAWVTYHYNECGFRSRESCGPKPPGTSRIVMMGSSAAQGMYVNYDHTVAERTAQQLTAALHRTVEVQNMGHEGCGPACVYRRMDMALGLKPDLIVLTITDYDLDENLAVNSAENDSNTNVEGAKPLVVKSPGLLEHIKSEIKESAVRTVVQHFIYEDPNRFIKLYMMHGDEADFVRRPFTQLWDERLQTLDLWLGKIAEKAQTANVPVVLLESPVYIQAALASVPEPPPGTNPFELGDRLRSIAGKHGILFVDGTNAFNHVPHANQFFYVVNGHLNPDGSERVSDLLVDALLTGERGALEGRLAMQASNRDGGVVTPASSPVK